MRKPSYSYSPSSICFKRGLRRLQKSRLEHGCAIKQFKDIEPYKLQLAYSSWNSVSTKLFAQTPLQGDETNVVLENDII